VTSNQRTTLLLALSTLLLAACDLPFLDDEAAKIEAKREAEGKAIGSGCRYSGRPLEECYGMNPKTSKAAMFAGWRDMDGYMRENNIQTATPEPETPAGKEEDATKPKAADASAGQSNAKGSDASAIPGKAKTADALAVEEKAKADAAAKEALGKQDSRTRKQPRRVA